LNLLGFFDSGFVLAKKAATETSRSVVISDAMLSVVVARIVGVNMLRFPPVYRIGVEFQRACCNRNRSLWRLVA
jgi:hypothetical protein